MKRARKRVLGFLGLTIVAATTVFAASLPERGASALSSVTDTVTIRVVGSSPGVNITEPSSGGVYVKPNFTFQSIYENVETATITLKRTDEHDVEHEYVIDALVPDYAPGGIGHGIDLSSYGYGKYVLSIRGVGQGDIPVEDSIAFTYLPVTGEVEEDDETGETYIDLDYDDENSDIEEIEIKVIGPDGSVVTPLSPITVTPPDTEVKIPFEDYKLPSGTYTIEIVAYDGEGEVLYKEYKTVAIYEPIPVPNTGGVLKNLNISRADYLATGLIAFFMFGIFGTMFILRKQKKPSRRK